MPRARIDVLDPVREAVDDRQFLGSRRRLVGVPAQRRCVKRPICRGVRAALVATVCLRCAA